MAFSVRTGQYWACTNVLVSSKAEADEMVSRRIDEWWLGRRNGRMTGGEGLGETMKSGQRPKTCKREFSHKFTSFTHGLREDTRTIRKLYG